jgi:cell division protein DivIC
LRAGAPGALIGARPTVNLRRLILSIYLALFAGVSVMAGIYFMDTREEYNRLKGIEISNQRALDTAQKRLADQQEVLRRLRTDPTYVERVIRQKLGYSKPDEMIFRFDD